jgi:hypothetical protein
MSCSVVSCWVVVRNAHTLLFSHSALLLAGRPLTASRLFPTTLGTLARRSRSVHPLVLLFITCFVRFLVSCVVRNWFFGCIFGHLCLVVSPLSRCLSSLCVSVCRAVLCCASLCYTALCGSMSYCVVLCCVGWSCVTHTLCTYSHTPHSHISAYSSQCTHTHTHTHTHTITSLPLGSLARWSLSHRSALARRSHSTLACRSLSASCFCVSVCRAVL